MNKKTRPSSEGVKRYLLASAEGEAQCFLKDDSTKRSFSPILETAYHYSSQIQSHKY
ncbi:hypothetical protein E2C01_068294 [Portunus trituberculatus]|uniref:Uncharacterized protein n=1 Tax=Portunus trituberculatus TaxID=210409 RepID=A0A5B7HM14_PORTR|nr:hypothetical protein [Portunus trituberculatus]